MSNEKDKFAFSKSKRFEQEKTVNHMCSYEPKVSDFERVIRTSSTEPRRPGMGGSSPRFEYYSNKRKQGITPSSFSYNNNTIATNRGYKSFLNQPNKAYSFGVSRQSMQKMHVDAILDSSAIKAANNPGPGQHELNFKWSLPGNTLRNKTSPQFSFSKSTTL